METYGLVSNSRSLQLGFPSHQGVLLRRGNGIRHGPLWAHLSGVPRPTILFQEGGVGGGLAGIQTDGYINALSLARDKERKP